MIYLSGPMTGLPEFNRPEFDKVANALRRKGHKVWSPADNFDRNVVMPRNYYMRKDIEALLECDAVAMLPDWEKSQGAILEYQIAKELGLPVLKVSGKNAEYLERIF